MHLLQHAVVKWLLPVPALAALGGVVWLFFRRTWRALDEEALAERRALHDRGEVDRRPLAITAMGLVVLTMQEYYGTGAFYAASVRPALAALPAAGPGGALDLAVWDDLLREGWWAVARVVGYLAPLAAWRLVFPQDRLRDCGLRVTGFRAHAWIYALCVAVVMPVLLVVRREPDFGAYYPFYRLAGRSWLDFGVWEALYLAQFLGLEIFFRGLWLRATRTFGAGAIFSMVVPYTMIHYGKPYLEASGAIVAGLVLGSLAARTRSIWAGFLVHSTVALLMDCLVLERRGTLPVALAPGSAVRVAFPGWTAAFWLAWAAALLVLAATAWRRWPALAARLRGA